MPRTTSSATQTGFSAPSRQEAVRDRRPERARCCALRVDVDPLRVVGRGGEAVDPLLRHLEPRGRAELGADEIGEGGHAAASSSAVSGLVSTGS
jgi:hypothetical protein